MFIEFRHVSETEGVTPAWWADRDIMLPGQPAADSYELIGLPRSLEL